MHNNDDPEEIYYQGIGTLGGQRVNLRITSDDYASCEGESCSWVKSGQLGQIPMKGTSTVTLDYDFVYDDDTPVDMDVLYLSFLDLDGPHAGTEVVRLHDAESYIVPDDTNLDITTGTNYIQASNYIFPDVPNPTDVNALTEEERRVTMVGKWSNVNSVRITITVTAGDAFTRFIDFGGAL